MNEVDRDQILAALIDRPDRREDLLNDARLSSTDREELSELVALADSVWLGAKGAPELRNDPVAAMLGLVPDPSATLAPSALAKLRRRANVKPSDLATALRERGWSFDTSDVFRWETRSAHDVPPAVIEDIANYLQAPVGDLLSSALGGSAPPLLAAVRAEPLFEQLAERWSRARHVSMAVATAALESRMLATVHRGEEPSAHQLLRSLSALVASVEESSEKELPP